MHSKHLNTKPYPCDRCSSKFTKPGQLRNHLRDRHGIDTSSMHIPRKQFDWDSVPQPTKLAPARAPRPTQTPQRKGPQKRGPQMNVPQKKALRKIAPWERARKQKAPPTQTPQTNAPHTDISQVDTPENFASQQTTSDPPTMPQLPIRGSTPMRSSPPATHQNGRQDMVPAQYTAQGQNPMPTQEQMMPQYPRPPQYSMPPENQMPMQMQSQMPTQHRIPAQDQMQTSHQPVFEVPSQHPASHNHFLRSVQRNPPFAQANYARQQASSSYQAYGQPQQFGTRPAWVPLQDIDPTSNATVRVRLGGAQNTDSAPDNGGPVFFTNSQEREG